VDDRTAIKRPPAGATAAGPHAFRGDGSEVAKVVSALDFRKMLQSVVDELNAKHRKGGPPMTLHDAFTLALAFLAANTALWLMVTASAGEPTVQMKTRAWELEQDRLERQWKDQEDRLADRRLA
jgi:hypothetical protein